MPPLAHAGHWLVQVAYFMPVVLFLVWLGWTVWRDRRSGSEPGASQGGSKEAGLPQEPAGRHGHEAHPPTSHTD